MNFLSVKAIKVARKICLVKARFTSPTYKYGKYENVDKTLKKRAASEIVLECT